LNCCFVDEKENWPELVALTSHFPELPGTEPGWQSAVTCENTGFDDAKRPRSTCGYAEGVDGINMHTPSSVPQTTTVNSVELRGLEPLL